MVLLWIVLGFLLTVILLLAVPVKLSFNVQLQAHQRTVRGEAQWLFGLVRIKFLGKSSYKAKPRPSTKQKKPAPRSRRRLSPMAALEVEGIIGHLLALMRRILKAIHIHHLDVQARLGLDDPADTGQAWALIGPLNRVSFRYGFR